MENFNNFQAKTHFWCANDFTKVDVHPCVTANQVSIVSLAILELNELKRRTFVCKRLFMIEKIPVFLPLDAIGLFSTVIAATKVKRLMLARVLSLYCTLILTISIGFWNYSEDLNLFWKSRTSWDRWVNLTCICRFVDVEFWKSKIRYV